MQAYIPTVYEIKKALENISYLDKAASVDQLKDVFLKVSIGEENFNEWELRARNTDEPVGRYNRT